MDKSPDSSAACSYLLKRQKVFARECRQYPSPLRYVQTGLLDLSLQIRETDRVRCRCAPNDCTTNLQPEELKRSEHAKGDDHMSARDARKFLRNVPSGSWGH